MALGNSSATCSIASSRASKASTESSIRATYLDGDLLVISSTNESDPSPARPSNVIIRAGVLDLMDPTNESSPVCFAAWPADGVSACTAGSNLGVFTADPCNAINFFSGLLLKDLVAALAAVLNDVLVLTVSTGVLNILGSGLSFINA